MLPQGRCGRWLLISYQDRLQMEGAKMVGGVGVWTGQLMQEDENGWDKRAAEPLSARSLERIFPGAVWLGESIIFGASVAVC